jgi:hypothetical protein
MPAGKFLAAAVLFLLIFTAPAFAREQPDDSEIRQKIIDQSVAAYMATGHPCACPYNSARNGSSCGGRSAYSKRGGTSPVCYPSDVTDQMVSDWKKQHTAQ